MSTEDESLLHAEVRRLRRGLNDVLSISGLLAQTVESECDPEDGVCHEHDLYEGECALLHDLKRIRNAADNALHGAGAR